MEKGDDQAREGIALEKLEGRRGLQRFFLFRLERLLHLSQDPTLVGWQRDLVKRAIYSTYLDCLAVGMADEARACLPGDQPPEIKDHCEDMSKSR